MKKKILILNNPYYAVPSYLNQAQRMKAEFQKLGVCADIKVSGYLICNVDNNNIVCNVSDYDACVYFDKDKYISEMLEKSGIRLFNSHNAMMVCDDKMLTYIALCNNQISIPKTMPGLLCYRPELSVSEQTIDEIEQLFGYPLIVKESYGSLGKGVYKADNRQELKIYAEKVRCLPHHFQEYVSSSAGRDVRIIVIGKKVCAAMLRRSDSDFRSNIELGGIGIPLDLSAEFKELAEKTARILNLDYCGIDVLFSITGQPIVCEVNSNAYFGGIEKVTGINVARAYAEYICAEIYNLTVLSE